MSITKLAMIPFLSVNGNGNGNGNGGLKCPHWLIIACDISPNCVLAPPPKQEIAGFNGEAQRDCCFEIVITLLNSEVQI
jgi:hypothetical protein